MGELRERLLNRTRPTAAFPLRVDDDTAAAATVAEAQMGLLLAAGTDRESEAREALQAAQAALHACYESITLRAMRPEDFEALADAHPPREGNSDDDAWNTDTFPLAVFLACAPPDLTAEEWQAFLEESVSDAEQAGLLTMAVAVNARTVDPSVPKDWTQILS